MICPYTPDQQQEWRVDFPQLMLRSLIAQPDAKQKSGSARLLARTDLQGGVATALAPIVNASAKLKPARMLMEKVAGISAVRLLPTFARVRFSKWFRSRQASVAEPARERVALFPTCLVEYQVPEVGKAMVGVLERNGFACDLPGGAGLLRHAVARRRRSGTVP